MEITKKEHATAVRAAKRFGLDNPSFGDIIDELTPSYRCQSRARAKNGRELWQKNRTPCDDPAVILRWKHLKDYALELVSQVAPEVGSPEGGVKVCDACHKPLTKRQERFCSSQCNGTATREHVTARQQAMPSCSRDGCEQPVRVRRNLFCSRACYRMGVTHK